MKEMKEERSDSLLNCAEKNQMWRIVPDCPETKMDLTSQENLKYTAMSYTYYVFKCLLFIFVNCYFFRFISLL